MTVSKAIDHTATGTTDTLATIVVKSNRLVTSLDETFVYNIEHFEK
jgi:hypothetical protein